MPAAGLADVRPRYPQPLVFGGRVEHAMQELAVTRLEPLLCLEHEASGRDAVGERIAHPLELVETGQPRPARRRGNASVDLDTGKALGRKSGQLVFEATDLPAQVGPSEALVAPYSERRERASVEQIRHDD